MQPLSAVQLAAHTVALAHAYGVHRVEEFLLQVPRPLQAKPSCSPAAQVVAPQLVPEAYCSHEPAPLHMPSRLQEAAPSSGHSLSGSVPLAIDAHVPFDPEPFLAAEQAWHVPAQA